LFNIPRITHASDRLHDDPTALASEVEEMSRQYVVVSLEDNLVTTYQACFNHYSGNLQFWSRIPGYRPCITFPQHLTDSFTWWPQATSHFKIHTDASQAAAHRQGNTNSNVLLSVDDVFAWKGQSANYMEPM
jgi:hypothetical protein